MNSLKNGKVPGTQLLNFWMWYWGVPLLNFEGGWGEGVVEESLGPTVKL